MGGAPPEGAGMSARFAWLLSVCLLAARLTAADTAEHCRALVISGDPGRPVVKPEHNPGDWSANFDRWRAGWQRLLVDGRHVPVAQVRALRSPDPADPSAAVPAEEAATHANVITALGALAKECTAQDQAVVVLIGHGYHSGASARFCLSDTDLSDQELKDALAPLACRELILLVLAPDCRDIDRTLAAPGRVIVLANVRASAPYFSEFLLRALETPETTLLAAFNQASLDAIHWYQNQDWDEGQHAWRVHGRANQEIWRHVYPRGAMTPGDDQAHLVVTANDPTRVQEILDRRVIAEVAGIDDSGAGAPATVYDAGPIAAPIEAPTPDAPGARAATIRLGIP
jgi:hypothetical protein